jgi:hypothetical protein
MSIKFKSRENTFGRSKPKWEYNIKIELPEIQDVPLATGPGISLIMLPLMKIL